jgi:hypothetical protein
MLSSGVRGCMGEEIRPQEIYTPGPMAIWRSTESRRGQGNSQPGNLIRRQLDFEAARPDAWLPVGLSAVLRVRDPVRRE